MSKPSACVRRFASAACDDAVDGAALHRARPCASTPVSACRIAICARIAPRLERGARRAAEGRIGLLEQQLRSWPRRSALRRCIERQRFSMPGPELLHEAAQPAFAAAQVERRERAADGPAQPDRLRDDRRRARRCVTTPLRHQRHALAEDGRLQPVGDEAADLLVQHLRHLAERAVEGHAPRRPPRATCASPGTTSTSGMMCGGLNGWPTSRRSGVAASRATCSVAGSAELDDSSSAPGAARRLDALPQRALEVQPLGAVLLHQVGVGDGALEVGLEAQLLGGEARRQAERAQCAGAARRAPGRAPRPRRLRAGR